MSLALKHRIIRKVQEDHGASELFESIMEDADFIVSEAEKDGITPTVEHVAVNVGISFPLATMILEYLEASR